MKQFIILFLILLITSVPYATEYVPHYDYIHNIQRINPNVTFLNATKITHSIFKYSKKYDIDPHLIFGVAKVESTFNHKVYSTIRKKPIAFGLMGIHGKVWVEDWSNKRNLIRIGLIENGYDLYKIDKNINAGIFILMEHRSYCVKRNNQNRLSVSIQKCMLLSYNGVNFNGIDGDEYYVKVIDYMNKIKPTS